MTTTAPLRLSTVAPDFEQILLQLQMYLSTKESWIDLLVSSTGETLMELIAAGVTMNQFGIEGSFREAFPSTAIRDSSIYAICHLLGVHITRKSPAQCTVNLTRSVGIANEYVLPKHTQFTINGIKFFNRDVIIFGQTVSTVSCVLYQGEVRISKTVSTGDTFQEIALDDTGFIVSDDDIIVTVIDSSSNTLWEALDEGLWIATRSDNVYYDATNGNGQAVLTFGDGIHGRIPNVGSTIQVEYIITQGSSGNNGLTGLQVQSSLSDITGVTTSTITSGSDEKSAEFYKYMAPHIYKAKRSAVTNTDYRALALAFNNSASVTAQSQRDIAPNDLRWMNVVRLCVLPQNTSQTTFSTTEWKNFVEYMEKRCHAAIHIATIDPVMKEVDVTLTIALESAYTPDQVTPQLKTNIQNLFKRRFDTLGKRISMSDIIEAADVTGIDYVIVNVLQLSEYTDQNITLNPTDLVPDNSLTYLALRNLNVNVRYSERSIFNERYLNG